MNHWSFFLIAMLCSYLLGSISFSYILVKQLKKVDIRDHGSGNAGATNTLRVLGKGPATIVLLLDALKGALAVILTLWMTDNPTWSILGGILAIIGHNWPIFFGFRGGKGIATTIGASFVIAWQAALVASVVAILVILLFRYVSLGSLLYTITLSLMIFILHIGPPSYFWMSLLIVLLALFQHRQNMIQLFQGKERKI
ncbi:acyl-phosphate glycerol-3-phosphate acyltransferase [Seinonella peptonophila]|uniref:Glycerol-3-phosphate acyltransferase n=1 Tax=Seinonella peptonophila TaxID=112248 RepID=A0A1M4TGZ8_9BACL|nr:glycerol-3-phosphate 1-O-acyltransferase PlsY [Seinonella peptonophila]SHE43716.1 acyl-phosphate glycerol-3-phosphate acyltransferase [Seinonella peptonophila]